MYRNLFFSYVEKCSIGFKSGEYGGMKIGSHPASLANLLVVSVLIRLFLYRFVVFLYVYPSFRKGLNTALIPQLKCFAISAKVLSGCLSMYSFIEKPS